MLIYVGVGVATVLSTMAGLFFRVAKWHVETTIVLKGLQEKLSRLEQRTDYDHDVLLKGFGKDRTDT